MTTKSLKCLASILGSNPLFQTMSEAQLTTLSRCARNAHVNAGSLLAREGDPADTFFLLKTGKIAIEIHQPPKGSVMVQTLEPGDVAGWSWLFEPHVWQFDLHALECSSILAFDGKCLREKCERDHELGYRLMKAFAKVMLARLAATRLQLLQVYGA